MSDELQFESFAALLSEFAAGLPVLSNESTQLSDYWSRLCRQINNLLINP